MALTIKQDAPTVWFLVKVPKITDKDSGTDQTAKRLREAVKDHHFGGEDATVRKLTIAEIDAIRALASRQSTPKEAK